ncbi:MAG: hypothetical protein GF383_03070 [Candidatus Lokiarchaeota archaeon]|nr:hypothetical protein [Candidatus Lokiarchaeota archaeon]MBD3338521.1 hypothetical protein [Candidatus Lokiarchaeota archaeon]
MVESRMKDKKRDYPTKEVEPENFLTNEEVYQLLKTKDEYKFKQEDYYKLYNCVHCRECGTSDERVLLKQKFLKDGNTVPHLNEMVQTLETYGTPYKNNKSRIKLPKGIKENSDTLLYFGCFTSVKTPKYGQHAAEYLIKQGVDYCVLEEEICCGYPIYVTGAVKPYLNLIEKNRHIFKEKDIKKIICVCPSCYMVFQEHYRDMGIEIVYFTDYLKPSKTRKQGIVSIQHACPLQYDKKKDVVDQVESILRDSGYEIADIPDFCCGGGVGHQLRKEISEKIAKIRVYDYKGDYVTYYCPDCYWFIRAFGRRAKIKPELKDLFELLE